ncbi:27621_t:CDS:2 [Gigaspora margarita]|uniref:27621_t:CDS:1 n=1 Tax=Gigaspora margarita TaxID=4874 RepID=A0ABN7VN21_GIGMA|nr:27621_t:CDS:2 [Gigaspora margarita]
MGKMGKKKKSNENNKTTQVDEATRAYIDNAYQKTISMIIEKDKELINQQVESQRCWNEQMQQTMDNCFNQLVQINWNNTTRQSENNQPVRNNQATNSSPVTISLAIEAREDLPQDNYLFTPTLNHMLANMILLASNRHDILKGQIQTEKPSIVKKGIVNFS